jgi:hypothetical protein
VDFDARPITEEEKKMIEAARRREYERQRRGDGNGAIQATATVTVNVVTAESVVNAANVVTRTSQAVPAVRWTLLINSMPQAFTGLDVRFTP